MAGARHVLALVAALAVTLGSAASGQAERAASVEKYVYAASPAGADRGSKETHLVTVTPDSSGVSYAFEIRFEDGAVDRGVIRSAADGDFLAAGRRRYGRNGAGYQTDSLWVEGSTLAMRTWEKRNTKTSRADLPRDRPVAVDASLLLWMRHFPFGDAAARDVFMADWSHRTVDVDVRDRGVETVAVPAGVFACHRMEVTVRVLVFRPKITFWITVDAPHILVQHRGKRGPFTPVFETRLTRMETR